MNRSSQQLVFRAREEGENPAERTLAQELNRGSHPSPAAGSCAALGKPWALSDAQLFFTFQVGTPYRAGLLQRLKEGTKRLGVRAQGHDDAVLRLCVRDKQANNFSGREEATPGTTHLRFLATV